MKPFLACVKKEWLEFKNTKKLKTYISVGIGCAAYALLTIFLMSFVAKYLSEDAEGISELMSIGKLTYSNSMMFFMSFMSIYFIGIIVVLTMNVVSKEISQRKWVLPLQSGVKPENMVAAKILTIGAVVCGTILISCIINFAVTLTFFDAKFVDAATQAKRTYAVGRMLYQYFALMVFALFIIVINISLNAITKKAWVGVLVSVLFLLVLPQVLSLVEIGSTTLSSYTPLLWYNEANAGMGSFAPAACYIISALATLGIMALFVFFAIKSRKVTSKNLQ